MDGHNAATYENENNLNLLRNDISKIISAAGSFDIRDTRPADISSLLTSHGISNFSYSNSALTVTSLV